MIFDLTSLSYAPGNHSINSLPLNIPYPVTLCSKLSKAFELPIRKP